MIRSDDGSGRATEAPRSRRGTTTSMPMSTRSATRWAAGQRTCGPCSTSIHKPARGRLPHRTVLAPIRPGRSVPGRPWWSRHSPQELTTRASSGYEQTSSRLEEDTPCCRQTACCEQADGKLAGRCAPAVGQTRDQLIKHSACREQSLGATCFNLHRSIAYLSGVLWLFLSRMASAVNGTSICTPTSTTLAWIS